MNKIKVMKEEEEVMEGKLKHYPMLPPPPHVLEIQLSGCMYINPQEGLHALKYTKGMVIDQSLSQPPRQVSVF